MRATLFIACLATFGACNWADFDDLADETWVHSTEKPSVGSTDYGTSILGVSTGTSGGRLAVIGNDSPSYSTLDYSAEGEASLGANPQRLGVHFIASLSETPIFVTDGMGKVALVERAIDAGNIAVVIGPADAVADTPFQSMPTPNAAVFAAGNLIVAAGATFYTLTGQGQPTPCMVNDPTFAAAALASDGTNLWVWTTAGALVSLPLSALTPCNGGMVPAPGNAFTTTGFMPAAGAKLHLIGTYAILTGHVMASRMGQVFVVDTASLTQVGTALAVDGLRSSTIAEFGGTTYLVLGVPDRAVDGVVAGQVELRAFTTTTGELAASPALLLNDAQPESGSLFGRSVTTMQFNNQTILVVAASSEIFAYYKTSLYDALP